jgi:APA family basic amino acid/polyamine antiporter
MIVGLDPQTLLVAAIWMLFGLVIYFAYGRKRSKLHNPVEIMPTASDFESTDENR